LIFKIGDGVMMLNKIVKVANKLDSLGLIKEADFLDQLITKLASEGDDDSEWDYYDDQADRELEYENHWSRQHDLQRIAEPPPVSEDDLRNAILENLKKQIHSDSVEITNMVWGDYHESEVTDLYCWRVIFNLGEMSVGNTVPVARVTSDFDEDSISVTGKDGETYYFFAFLD
jgi:hypothetical protein